MQPRPTLPPRRRLSRLLGPLFCLLGLGYSISTEGAEGNCCSRSACSDCLWCRETLFSWESIADVREEPSDPNEEKKFELDRPDFIEASSTIGCGRLAIEGGYTYNFNNDAGVQTITHSYPETLFRIGMLAEWFELRISQNFATEQIRDSGTTSRASGAEDLYLGIKLGMTQQAEWLPESALILQMTVPTGASKFTADKVLPGLNYVYSWQLTEVWDMAGSTAANRAVESVSSDYLEIAQAWAFGYAVADDARAYVEWYGLLPHGASDVNPQYYGDIGLSWFLTPNLEVDVRMGIGLNEAADDYFTGAGGGVRF
jgi:outer membrane putative beta-barrel porin/alpha-amylase